MKKEKGTKKKKESQNLAEDYFSQLEQQKEEIDREIAEQERNQQILSQAPNSSYVHELLEALKPEPPKERIKQMKRAERSMIINEALALIGKSIAAWEGIMPQPVNTAPILNSMYKRWQLEDDFNRENRQYKQMMLSDLHQQKAFLQKQQAAAQAATQRRLEQLYKQREELDKDNREAWMTNIKAQNEREIKKMQHQWQKKIQKNKTEQPKTQKESSQTEDALCFQIPGSEETITIPPEVRTYLQAIQWEKPSVREDLQKNRNTQIQQQILNQGVISDYLEWLEKNK